MRTTSYHTSILLISVYLMLIGLLATASLSAQPNGNKGTELGFSGSFDTYRLGYRAQNMLTFLLSQRAGFFMEKNLELEPEIMLMLGSKTDPVYMLSANASYNFVANNRCLTFVLLGYGVTNKVPLFNPTYANNDFTTGVLNAGLGVKVFPAEDTAIRIEYRFQYFTGESAPIETSCTSISSHTEVRIYSIHIGLSVFI
jgi:hypothetical protein